MSTKKISIAEDFSKFPGPRYITLGPNSGELFREEILKPALAENPEKILINLDGTMGYGSSFLDEAFGGLVREEGYNAKKLIDILDFVSDEEPELIDDIRDYIDSADS